MSRRTIESNVVGDQFVLEHYLGYYNSK